MLDIGWTELLVIAVILIVVVGPKDLPPMIRAFGKMTKRLRQTAGEFRSQFDEALREAELDDLKKTVDDFKSLNPTNSIRETLNPLRQMGQDIKSDLQKASRVDTPTAASSATAAAAAVGVPAPENSILPDLPTGTTSVPPDLTQSAAVPVTAAAQSEPASAVPVPPAAAKPRKAAPKKAAVTENAPMASAPASASPERKPAKPKASASTAVVAAPVTALSVPVATTAAKSASATAKPAATKSAVTKGAVIAPAASTTESAPAARKPRQKKSEDRA